ncbi:MAG: winged helix-turn-helix transcriptional regulator [Bryobacterales bacterium]|nr:winged helix-turn-helix transcriptional regulator [Bryobacterales bacterium]
MGPEKWTFLTNYSHVLLSIAADPAIRLRDVAERVGITERAAQRIVADLIEAGYLTSEKEGRRNRYQVNEELPLRHPIEQHRQVADLLALLEPLRSRHSPEAKKRTKP